MPRYMILASYTSAAIAAFTSKPQERSPVLGGLIQRMGGTLISMDFCTNEFDTVVMAELPDDVTAAGLGLAIGGAGHLKSTKIVRLLSGQEFLAAQHKAHGLVYEAPKA